MISKVELIDIIKKVIKWDKKLEIYTNGKNNAYPEKSDRLINNSVTAKMSSLLMIQFLMGKGFGETIDEAIINSEENTTLKDFSKNIAEDITNNRGVWIHVSYELKSNGTIKPCNPRVLPFDWCRIGKKDSKKYNGKILVKEDWKDSKEAAVSYDVFNLNEAVVKAQIEKAGSLEKYKGQVYYWNADNKYYYPLSRIDSVMSDCDSEAQSGNYKNQLLRNGFFGKTVAVTRPLIDETVDEWLYEDEGSEAQDDADRRRNPEYDSAVSEAEETAQSIKDFIGAENAGGIMLLEMDNAGDKLEDAIKFIKIESEINPELFIGVEQSVRENILIAFNNLPIGLIKSNDGLFSNSAEAILEMKNTYWENTSNERDALEYIVNKFAKFVLGKEEKLKVIPLISQETPEEKETQKQQFKLKSSLEGITALLAIQQSVASGASDKESATQMISEAFGVCKEKATIMLGAPKVNKDAQPLSITFKQS